MRKTKNCTEADYVPQVFWMLAEENCLRGKLIIKNSEAVFKK